MTTNLKIELALVGFHVDPDIGVGFVYGHVGDPRIVFVAEAGFGCVLCFECLRQLIEDSVEVLIAWCWPGGDDGLVEAEEGVGSFSGAAPKELAVCLRRTRWWENGVLDDVRLLDFPVMASQTKAVLGTWCGGMPLRKDSVDSLSTVLSRRIAAINLGDRNECRDLDP